MSPNNRLPILLIFFLTGVSALIYQIAWVRQATLVFGVSVYAYSVVLAAFMGGLALGSYLMGGRADEHPNPLRLFAQLQIGIAILGFISPFVLTGLMPLYGNIARSLAIGSAGLTGIRALFSILVLVPPTLLMGAALPVMARAFVQRDGGVGQDVGRLYAADTFGAALGCALTGLFLLRTLGTRETIFVAVGLNLIAGAIAWFIARQGGGAATEHGNVAETKSKAKPKKIDAVKDVASQAGSGLVPAFVLWAYALSGFVALGYELVWARVLAVFTLDAVFSFAIMLTTYLFGITIGGWLASARLAKQSRNGKKTELRQFVDLQMWLGLSALGTLFVFSRLASVNLEEIFGEPSLSNMIYYEFLLGFLTLLVPTIFLGMLFPIAISLVTQEQSDSVGRQVGRVNGLNTIGAVAGSLVVGFGLIPLVGLQASGAILACLSLVIGFVASWIARVQGEKVSWLPHAGIALGIVLIMLLPDGYYLGFRNDATEQMIFYGEGVETTVAVFEVPEENFKVSFVNGRIEVPTDDVSMAAFRLLGHLPPLLKPDAEQALMLSFGNGIATGSLNTHEIPHIDAVDLSAQQFEAAEHYWVENHNVLRSPRLTTYVEDGRNFLLQTEQRYDIITTDATHPVNTASWALFTQEFYQSVSSRLTDDGVFLQWLPFHNLTEPDYKTILRTFRSVFPHATLWYTGGSHTLLLATPETLTEEMLAARLSQSQNEQVAEDLATSGQIPNFVAMWEDEYSTYVGEGALVTDNNAYFLPQDQDNMLLLAKMEQAVQP